MREGKWVERLARYGYATKGAVYIIVGTLATLAALGAGGRTTDSRGVFQEILEQPFGRILLVAVIVGLFGYAAWRFIAAIMDADNKGTDAKGIFVRVGYAISGVIHTGLAFSAVRLAVGSGGGGDSQRDWTRRLLAMPMGPWLVGLAGFGIIGFGLYQFYKGFTAKFRKRLNLGEMSKTEDAWGTRISRFGLAARGVVFAIIGIFLIRAAIQYDPNQARGLEGALETLAGQPFGRVVLGVVAVGLIAYGIYKLVEARYRRISPA